jgi:hypothetical protein
MESFFRKMDKTEAGRGIGLKGIAHYKHPRIFTSSTRYTYETAENRTKTFETDDHGPPEAEVKKRILGKVRTFGLVEYKPCLEQYEVRYKEKR